MGIKVVHLSTAHGRNEIRVHLKECNTLASNLGYDVNYIVADGLGNEIIGNVCVSDIGLAGGRFLRMLIRPWQMLLAARRMDARIYHFHDPELLLIALFLRIGGKVVIYDSHEDTPRSLLSREWIPAFIRPSISSIFERFENFVAKRLSGIIGATPLIGKRFSKINPRSITINNYPLESEIEVFLGKTNSTRTVCYLGAISRIRGIEQMIEAIDLLDAKLILAGAFEDVHLESRIRRLSGWSKVDYRGVVSRLEAQQIMADSSVGLVLYHPEPNHIDAQPNKMFEYMAAGLPVVASNFPLWREIIEVNDVGLCANPLDSRSISIAIENLLFDPGKVRLMGLNGRKAVREKYTWSYEGKNLLAFYAQVLKDH